MNNIDNEIYLNHPTFGLLYRICVANENQELFTTLYAQRLFFVVSQQVSRLTVEPIGRSDARLLVENRLRKLRATGSIVEYQQLQTVYKRTF